MFQYYYISVSMNVPSLSTEALQSNNNQSGFSRQRRNVHTIICLSLHACLYLHHCDQRSSSVCQCVYVCITEI